MNKILLPRTLLTLAALFLGTLAWADNVTLTASAPDVVVSGDQFRLSYTVNTQKVKDFRAPTIADFEVLMGPSQSQSSSTQIVNGNISTSSSITYTYVLQASREGTFTIPAATIVAGGNTVKSNSVTIKVLPPDKASGVANGGGNGGHTQQRGNSANSSSARNQVQSGKISDKDLFITATASKTKVYEQEAILLTYKVYTRVDLRSLDPKMPDLKGFHTQEVDLPRQKRFTMEHYNGYNYNTMVWSQYVLFPQQAGDLEIPSVTFESIVAQTIQTDDPFEAFFNGRANYMEVKKNISTPKITIHVAPLPANKPNNFCGAVGDFNISSTINTTQLMTNDAVTVKVVLSGVGNMKLIQTPELAFPQDFEIYDPKVDNQFTLTEKGLSGNKVIEYLAIPRYAGTYKIPALELSYFDINAKTYKTLTTEPYELHVEKGKGDAEQVVQRFTSKEDLKVLGKDIRFIKSDSHLYPQGVYFVGSVGYALWYLIPLALLIALLAINRKRAIENANIAKMRNKKANKVATKRLKHAQKLLAENQQGAFYDEMLKTLWGYISDKLTIPVSELSKDNIEQELQKSGVTAEAIAAFLAILNRCEFARYAPGSDNKAMDEVYTHAIATITQMENQMKKR